VEAHGRWGRGGWGVWGDAADTAPPSAMGSVCPLLVTGPGLPAPGDALSGLTALAAGRGLRGGACSGCLGAPAGAALARRPAARRRPGRRPCGGSGTISAQVRGYNTKLQTLYDVWV